MLLPSHLDVVSDTGKAKDVNRKEWDRLKQGLYYPDIPCATYEIIESMIEMDPVLCSQIRIFGLGKAQQEVQSQLEDSHNGVSATNHSMAISEEITNTDIKALIVRKLVILFYIALTREDTVWLGMILHAVQDSWSPSHTYRIISGDRGKQPMYDLWRERSNFFPDTDGDLSLIRITQAVYIAAETHREELETLYSTPSAFVTHLILLMLEILGVQDNPEELFERVGGIPEAPKKAKNDTYKNMSKQHRRLYKLALSNMYMQQYDISVSRTLNLNESLPPETDRDSNRPLICVFLYYPVQDDKVHAVRDCNQIIQQTPLYRDKNIWEWAVHDTGKIIDMYLDYVRSPNKTQQLLSSTMREFLAFINDDVYAISEECKGLNYNTARALQGHISEGVMRSEETPDQIPAVFERAAKGGECSARVISDFILG